MAYVNTGHQRATTLTIRKFNNGVLASTAAFDMRLAFGEYSAVTDTDIAQMPQAEYEARVNAYAAYITATKQSDYPGLVVTNVGSHPYNAGVCPLP
jgi:cephalosporin hydroxylase